MHARRPVMVVFGLPGNRQRSYARLSSMGSTLKLLGTTEIVDIGPEFDAPSMLHGIPVRPMGLLSAADLASVLSQSMFGFVPHPPFCSGKSGIFAALCANGTIPVLAESFSEEIDGLKDGVHLVTPRTAKSVLTAGPEHCSAAGWRWYMGHKLHVHAETYARLLVPEPTQTQTQSSTAHMAAGGRI
jgi:hypothetical protein